jgi:GxxExxY protein
MNLITAGGEMALTVGETQRRKDAEMIEPTRRDNSISGQIVDSAFAVHSTLGPGLLESVYEQCLACELTARNIIFQRQVALPVIYRNTRIDAGYRIDMVVDNSVIVEIKAAEKMLPIHEAQLLTYLKLSGYLLGLLINFNTVLIKDGIKRMVRSS